MYHIKRCNPACVKLHCGEHSFDKNSKKIKQTDIKRDRNLFCRGRQCYSEFSLKTKRVHLCSIEAVHCNGKILYHDF